MAEIRVEALCKTFGDFLAVKGSTFTVASGEFFCLLGPSGCGKTTTLRMIAGLELPTSGRILLGGEDVTFRRAAERDIAFVFQLFALYPHMSVRANIAFPLKCQGMRRAEIRPVVETAARILRITNLLDRPVSGLTSGDRQRVALGRAIVRQPKAFMMDEPLGALDSELRHIMIAELRMLHNRLQATTIYVTHDQLEAMAMADKVAVMSKGEIVQLGTPKEIYERPASLFVADFIGSPSMNFLDFRSGLSRGTASIRLGEGIVEVPEIHEDLEERDLVLGVRPEHVRIAERGIMPADVFGTEYLGTMQLVTLATPHGMLRARIAANVPVRRGERVAVNFLAPKLSLFEKSSGRAVRTGRAMGELRG
ncbi:MAG: ABC transporter ATP-binding protein [Proteobacteria bacterium]|nr:ABC transporter ATP-binding protein [Pseudomonadota bacterium]MBI3499972.1 ABC transporter ATP-binding protein [Pseudomonadota bacterium]